MDVLGVEELSREENGKEIGSKESLSLWRNLSFEEGVWITETLAISQRITQTNQTQQINESKLSFRKNIEETSIKRILGYILWNIKEKRSLEKWENGKFVE